MKKFIPVAMFLLLISLIFGCSGSSNPAQTTVQAPETSPQSAMSSGGGQILIGSWDISIDPDTMTAEIAPSRTSDFTLNVTLFLGPPMNPIQLITVTLLPDSTPGTGFFAVDIGIKHPFPQFPMYRCFDWRGILMSDGSTVSGLGNDLIYPGPDETHVVNADGWTRWFNSTEFTNYDIILGYCRGSLTAKLYPNATLNGYKYYADDLDATESVADLDPSTRGTFFPHSEKRRRYEIQFKMVGPQPQFDFSFNVCAGWEEPDPAYEPDYPIEAFSLNANCQEAYFIDADFDGSTAWYEGPGQCGGNLHVSLEIGDWGALEDGITVPDEIFSIVPESPNLGVTPGCILDEATITEGNGVTSSVFTFDLEVTPSGAEDQWLVIEVQSSDPTNYEPQLPGGQNFDYPDEPLAAYMIFDVPILPANPCPDVTVTGVSGMLGQSGGKEQAYPALYTGVSITGSGFDGMSGGTPEVTLTGPGGSPVINANVTSHTDTVITCNINFIGADFGYYDVEVENDCGAVGIGNELVEVIDTPPDCPDVTVTGVSGMEGQSGGKEQAYRQQYSGVIITGSGFNGQTSDEPDISFIGPGGSPVINGSVTNHTDTQITCTVNFSSADLGIYDITVQNECGESGTGDNLVEVIEFPCPAVYVTSVSGMEGQSGGKEIAYQEIYNNVYIHGSGGFAGLYNGTPTVTLTGQTNNPSVSNVQLINDTQVKCTINFTNASLGLYDVQVENDCGEIGIAYDEVQVICPPVSVTSVSGFDSGSQATQGVAYNLTIYGSGFDGGPGNPSVEFYGPATVQATGETLAGSNIQCSVTFPIGGPTGLYSIRVTNSCGSQDTLYGVVTVIPPTPCPEVTVTGVSGMEGQSGGKEQAYKQQYTGVTISGTGFAGLSSGTPSVTVTGQTNNPTVSSVNLVNDTTITCTIDFTIADYGTYDVTVENDCGESGIGNDLIECVNEFPDCNEVYEEYTYSGTFVGNDGTGRAYDLAFTNTGYCLSKYYPYPAHSLHYYNICQNGNSTGTQVIYDMVYGEKAMMGIDVDDSWESSRGNIIYFVGDTTQMNKFFVYTETGTYIGSFDNPNTSRINALDTDDDGGLWVVGHNTWPLLHVYINHWTWNGSIYVYDASRSTEANSSLKYDTSNLFFFDCAVNYEEEKLIVFAPGTTPVKGLLAFYDISNVSVPPQWEQNLVNFLPYNIYIAQYGNYWDYGSDIEIDHTDSSMEYCRILVMAANSTGCTFMKLDVSGNIRATEHTNSTLERFNAIAIRPVGTGVDGSCMVGNRISTYNYQFRTYRAPDGW